jgi:glycosyltransferase involved in cell wall biosynthesis
MLIAATSFTRSEIEQSIAASEHQRLDYAELARRLGADCLDYGVLASNGPTAWLERKLRLDIRLGLAVRRAVYERGHSVVLSMSERVGIPLASILDREIGHVVRACHPLSPQKFRLIRLLGVVRRWDVLAVYTQAEADVLADRLGLPPERIMVLPDGVDVDFFHPSAEQQETGRSDYILSVGLSYRDYATLFRALRCLPGVRARVLAGSAWTMAAVGSRYDRAPENVELLDPVRPDVLRSRYAACRFVVVPLCPTTQWSAGGNAVAEAQAMGKAVIATRTPGMPDYVLDGQTGLLVEQGNSAALAEAIEYLWNNPGQADAMGRRARQWVEATFSLDRWLDRFADVLTDLRAGPGGSASASRSAGTVGPPPIGATERSPGET